MTRMTRMTRITRISRISPGAPDGSPWALFLGSAYRMVPCVAPYPYSWKEASWKVYFLYL